MKNRATKLPFTGDFQVTCIYGKKGKSWSSGVHQGIDLVGKTNKKVYAICHGVVERAGYDNGGFGNYVRIKEDGTENRIYLAHLEKIYVQVGQKVNYATVVGLMGSTGNSTGAHTHVEIRKYQNGVAVSKLNPATYMGIPNVVGIYNSANYQIKEEVKQEVKEEKPVVQAQPILKTLSRNTNLRSAPDTSASKVLYKTNTTVYVLEAGVAKADGYTWDRVRIRINGKEGYMINQNYK